MLPITKVPLGVRHNRRANDSRWFKAPKSSITSAVLSVRNPQRPRDLEGISISLLAFARKRSLTLGFHGQAGLYSLPEVVGLYELLGMTWLELEPKPRLNASKLI